MAKIQRSLSTKVNDNGKSEIMLRLSLSKNDKIRIKSNIFVLASRFKDGTFIKSRANQRALHRFEMYQRLTSKKSYKFSFDTCTTEEVYAFEAFLRAEPELYDQYPNIYKSFPSITHKTHKVKRPKPRGDNYMVTFTKRFKALFHWCHAQGITMNNPFVKYVSSVYEKYGTPSILRMKRYCSLPISISHTISALTRRGIYSYFNAVSDAAWVI